MTPVQASLFDPQIDPTGTVYKPGSALEVPGSETILEYGDFDTAKNGRIPGAMAINDHSRLDKVRINQIDGLHDDPDASENRQANADRHGETAGRMLYRGRTIGLTGRVEAGNIGAMRDNWRRFRSQFGVAERDLLIHHPFERRTLTNEVLNPRLAFDTKRWAAPTSTGGGTATLTAAVAEGATSVGALAVASATGAGFLQTYGDALDVGTGLPVVSEWHGEDVWLSVRVKSHAVSGGVISSITLGLNQYVYHKPSSVGSTLLTALATVTSPVIGTWQTVSVRVPASSIAPATTHLAPLLRVNFSAAGSYTVRFFNYALVFLGFDQATPTVYFDGDTSGFEWNDVPGRSSSTGPSYAENKVLDPRFENYDVNTKVLTYWAAMTQVGGTAPTYSPVPTRANGWSGSYVDGSLYVKATKNEVSTTAFGVVALDAAGNTYYRAGEQRIYRFSAKIKALQIPSAGLRLAVSWLREDGSVISTSTSAAAIVGENTLSVQATAPTRTCAARLLAQVSGSASTGNVLEFLLSDPCFVDITDWDPGNFYGVGDGAQEAGNRRRVPSSFLVRHVRKTSDMKAPEQQARNRAWRDFTMSLRAGDPRIYVAPQRRISIRLPPAAVLKFFSTTFSTAVTLATPAAVPTGFTYEGQNVPATVGWSTTFLSDVA